MSIRKITAFLYPVFDAIVAWNFFKSQMKPLVDKPEYFYSAAKPQTTAAN
jgi:hypothetical protein